MSPEIRDQLETAKRAFEAERAAEKQEADRRELRKAVEKFWREATERWPGVGFVPERDLGA